MTKLHRSKIYQDLGKYRVYVEDAEPNSRYFQIRNPPDILHAGKNAIVIAGSENLVDDTEVLVEILDENGDVVFNQPIRNYAEGRARIVSVEIYEDTPPGPGLLTILGQLATTDDGQPVPDQWKNSYNIRWQKRITIDPGATNNTKIRLYNIPTLDVDELLFIFRKSVTGSLQTIYSTGTNLWAQHKLAIVNPDSTWLIRSVGIPPFNVSQSFVGGTFEGIPIYDCDGNFTTTRYSGTVTDVLSDTTFRVSPPMEGAGTICYVQFVNYTMSYSDNIEFSATTLTRSFADIQLNNLQTFSGQLARSKIFFRSVDQELDYEYLSDQAFDTQYLTVTQSATLGPAISMGHFISQSVIDAFWHAGYINRESINDFPVRPAYVENPPYTLEIDNAKLISSMHLSFPDLHTHEEDWPAVYFAADHEFLFLEDSEYELTFNALCYKLDDITAKMEVYLTGSAIPDQTNALGTLLGTYEIKPESSSLSTSTISALLSDNSVIFRTPNSGSGHLKFVLYGGDWYVNSVVLQSALERGFNPDFARYLTPISGRRYENLQFKAQLFDPDNNQYPEEIFSDIVFFDGGNLLLRGPDHRLDGTLTVSPSGSGVTITSEGWRDEDGSFRSGSAIYMGEGQFFHKDTAILISAEADGDPRLSMGDKLKAYVDETTGEFILQIFGTILVGSGSDARDVRYYFPSSISDDWFHRIRGIDLDFWDLMGRKAFTAGQIDATNSQSFDNSTQIGRLGSYTRGSTGRVVPPEAPLVLPAISSSIDPFVANAVSESLASSGSLYVSPGMMIWNNTLYANILVTLNEALLEAVASDAYNVYTELIVDTSWVGYESGTLPGTTYAPDFSGTRNKQTVAVNNDIWVTQTGSYGPAPYLTYPIHIPEDRPANYNTLYVVIRLDVNTSLVVV